MAYNDNEDDPETYPTPLQHQRVFGAGIKRKRIAFIPAADTTPSSTVDTVTKGQKVAQRYLEIVSASRPPLPLVSTGTHPAETGSLTAPMATQITGSISTDPETSQDVCQSPAFHQTAPQEPDPSQLAEICPLCSLPVSITTSHLHTHESLLAHQVSMPHVYPVSALDRSRYGLRYLASHGWDPDSRKGLGVKGEGRREPVKAVPKRNTLGIGVEVPKSRNQSAVKKATKKLGAKEMRTLAAREKKDREKLQGRLYGKEEEIERILRGS